MNDQAYRAELERVNGNALIDTVKQVGKRQGRWKAKRREPVARDTQVCEGLGVGATAQCVGNCTSLRIVFEQ